MQADWAQNVERVIAAIEKAASELAAFRQVNMWVAIGLVMCSLALFRLAAKRGR
jgi:hypothetical protein